jgi:hypothetical protein
MLLDGVDKLYLEAEILWRQGRLREGIGKLETALRLAPGSEKCCDLDARLRKLYGLMEECAEALDSGECFPDTAAAR